MRKRVVKNTNRNKGVEVYEAETLEQKIEKVVSSKEPIDNTAPIIYTEKKLGVQPQYDIRTDRFDIALEAMDKVNKTLLAKRDDLAKMEDGHKMPSADTPENN